MHEMSVAMEICAIAERQLEPSSLPFLVEVGVEVGAHAGVEPSNLQFCLEALLATHPFSGARAVIERSAGDVLRLNYLEIDDERTSH
jgi:Zn finger protein HypA/HybF involved in hydrogenase expression